jgi:hypothetical protein
MNGFPGDSPADFIQRPGPLPCSGSLREEVKGGDASEGVPGGHQASQLLVSLDIFGQRRAVQGGPFPLTLPRGHQYTTRAF